MSSCLSDDSVEQENIKIFVIKTIEYEVSSACKKKYLSLKSIVKSIIFFLLNENIEKFIKGFLSKWFGYSSRLSLNKVAKNFIKQGIKVDVEEVKKIESLIISFHARKKSY